MNPALTVPAPGTLTAGPQTQDSDERPIIDTSLSLLRTTNKLMDRLIQIVLIGKNIIIY